MISVIVECKGVYEIWQIELNNIYLNCLKFKTQNFSGDAKMRKFFNEKTRETKDKIISYSIFPREF